jgi:hypothetical protein
VINAVGPAVSSSVARLTPPAESVKLAHLPEARNTEIPLCGAGSAYGAAQLVEERVAPPADNLAR